jgi:hypothetical protein
VRTISHHRENGYHTNKANLPALFGSRCRAAGDGKHRYFVSPLHFWSQYLVSRVFRYFVPVCVSKNRVHGTVIS